MIEKIFSVTSRGTGKPDYFQKVDVVAQSIGIFLQPEWAVKEGEDRTIIASAANKAPGANVALTYTVPVGKTLYTMQVSAFARAVNVADADNQHAGLLTLYPFLGSSASLWPGFNTGFAISLVVPIRSNAGQILYATVTNISNHNCDLGLSIAGYEV